MSKYLNLEKQLVRLYRLDLSSEEVIKQFLLTACTEDVTEVRHGRWVCADDFYESGVCSVCKWNSGELHGICVKEWHYCPNCGARMDIDESDVWRVEDEK